MPSLIIRFPAGRYHATPWGHHVNEGLVEWPPSPWRLLRALLATGFNTLQWSDVPDAAAALIQKLASTDPSYELPRVTYGHCRHYMPMARFKNGKEETALAIDTWVNVKRERESPLERPDEIVVGWAIELSDPEFQMLELLAGRINYLGRSESWVSVSADRDAESRERRGHVFRADPSDDTDRDRGGPGWKQVTLPAPVESAAYQDWRLRAIDRALEPFAIPDGKKPTKKLSKQRAGAVAPYPETILDCLRADTKWMAEHGWSQPPGSRKALYWIETSVHRSPRRIVRLFSKDRVEYVLLVLAPQSRNRGEWPLRHQTIKIADQIHAALAHTIKERAVGAVEELLGRDAAGNPLRTGHQHGHILPLDLNGDGRLDHVLLWAPGGFGLGAQNAIRDLRSLHGSRLRTVFDLAIAGSGTIAELRETSDRNQPRLHEVVGPHGGAKTWVSHTPFLAPRFVKPRGGHTLEAQVRAELASRGISSFQGEGLDLDLVGVEILRDDAAIQRDYLKFDRVRRRGSSRAPVDLPLRLRITFPACVAGPVSLGYGSHFGLGQFRVETEPGEGE